VFTRLGKKKTTGKTASIPRQEPGKKRKRREKKGSKREKRLVETMNIAGPLHAE